MPAPFHDPVRYLICGTPRTGTTLLCKALAATGVAGLPNEYFEPSRLRERGRLDPNPGVVLRRILDEAATPNGVSGSKMMWAQLVRLGSLDKTESSQEAALRDLIERLPPLRYIWMRRRDKVRQSVSYARAFQTGLWLRDSDPTSVRQPVFNWDALESQVCAFQAQEESWRRFFDAAGVTPLCIDYEDLDERYEETIRRAFAFLGVESASVPPPGLKRQADRLTEQWVKRYHNPGEPNRIGSPARRLDPGLVLQLLRGRWRSFRRRLSA